LVQALYIKDITLRWLVFH